MKKDRDLFKIAILDISIKIIMNTQKTTSETECNGN